MPFAVYLAALASTWSAALDAPITAVTVYSDRARVTRTATVTLSGAQRLEFPLLPAGVDPSTLRVEATGAEVRAVDLAPVEAAELPLDEGRKLVRELDALDDQLRQVRGEADAHRAQLELLGGLEPAMPEAETLRPLPKLDPSGWNQADTFVAELTARLQARLLDVGERLAELERQRARTQEQARLLGATRRGGGHRVTVRVQGNGSATLRLSYLIDRARWNPTYDIQLLPDTRRVRISFSGLVNQETGEDWRDAALTLSTAVPATSTVFPKLLTWKLGEKERFIPTPEPLVETVKPPPAAPPLPTSRSDMDLLREKLAARAGAEEENKQKIDQAPKAERTFEALAKTPSPPAETETKSPDGLASLTGQVTDAATHQPLADVVVILTSSTVSGEQVGVTDLSGFYRFPELSAGTYTVQLDKEAYKPTSRGGLELHPGQTTRLNMQLLPDSTRAEEVTVVGRAPTVDVGSTSAGVTLSGSSTSTLGGRGILEAAPQSAVVAGSLQPPAGYVAPQYDPDLPASLAGGNDLSYPSLRRETLESGKGARRVALFSETWPVSVERKILPALAPEAFLVAELKSPSAQILPGGMASLAVGDDPAGSARIKQVAPGEGFTLPLGIDRAIKPVHNVSLVQAEKGLIGKDEVGQYIVTDEIPNPYPFPIQTRIYDQWPLAGDKDVQVELLRAEPWAIQDKAKGSLEWDLTVPAHGKVTVTFVYSLRRPKGWRLHQEQ